MTAPAAAGRDPNAYGRRGVWQPVDPRTYQSPWTAPAAEPRQVFAGPGYTGPKVRVSPVAMTAFVFGLLSFPIAPLAIVAIVCGIVALGATRHGAPGRGYARGGLVLGAAAAGVWLTFFAMIAALAL
ncbi:hypothetical protein GCG21_02995 [Pseudactinotalea sp. HY160]|uniref:DUF4190 domain-containing protein n=1 Tax=Pseudactinotalea sp. HY160 TaxID=2654490 RepID=UPI00128C4588|nr:DUF4190 domain-containing protein [Pseudactinotalea sp. HY160]MPV48990.1 hypothetical protein [Pseudactinotalea sp. HY160]